MTCPHCGEERQIETTPTGWRCDTCSKAWDAPLMTERMLKDAALARLLFVKRPHEDCDDDPDPDYGL